MGPRSTAARGKKSHEGTSRKKTHTNDPSASAEYNLNGSPLGPPAFRFEAPSTPEIGATASLTSFDFGARRIVKARRPNAARKSPPEASSGANTSAGTDEGEAQASDGEARAFGSRKMEGKSNPKSFGGEDSGNISPQPTEKAPGALTNESKAPQSRGKSNGGDDNGNESDSDGSSSMPTLIPMDEMKVRAESAGSRSASGGVTNGERGGNEDEEKKAENEEEEYLGDNTSEEVLYLNDDEDEDVGEDEDDGIEDDDEEEDDGCPHIPLMLQHMIRMAAHSGGFEPDSNESDAEESRDSDSDSESDSCCSDDIDSSSGEQTRQCAICFRRTASRLVVLPCCGSDGREDTSSTRFCAKCLLRLAKKQYDDVPEPSSGALLDAYVEACGGNGDGCRLRIGECPRCRSLLAVSLNVDNVRRVEDDDDSEDGCSCEACLHQRYEGRVKTASDLVLRTTTHGMAACYAMQRQEYKSALKIVSHAVRPDRIPLALLGCGCGDEAVTGNSGLRDRVDKLCRWGLLSPCSVGSKDKFDECPMYSTDPEMQLLLRAAASSDISSDDNEEEHESFFFQMFVRSCRVGWTEMCKFHVGTALVMYNQALSTALFANGFIPKPPFTKYQRWTLVFLNVVLVSMAVQCLSIAAIYAATAFLLAKAVGKSMANRCFLPKLFLAIFALLGILKLLKFLVGFLLFGSFKGAAYILTTAIGMPLRMVRATAHFILTKNNWGAFGEDA